MEKIETKLDEGLPKLQTEIEKVGTEMRAMFEQLMNKDVVKNTGTHVLTTLASKDGTSSSNLKEVPPTLLVELVDTSSGCFHRSSKPTKLEYPYFDGGDFFGWFIKLEQFLKVKNRGGD